MYGFTIQQGNSGDLDFEIVDLYVSVSGLYRNVYQKARQSKQKLFMPYLLSNHEPFRGLPPHLGYLV